MKSSEKRKKNCDLANLFQGLEPPKPVRQKAPVKEKKEKKEKTERPPATLVKTPRVPIQFVTRRGSNRGGTTVKTSTTKKNVSTGPRVLQKADLEKLARLNCSREFSLFHQFIKSQLSTSIENQLAFLQTKLHHLKNEFANKRAEHLNFEQIREYFNQAVQEHVRRQIKPDEFLTLAEKFRQDIKMVSMK